MIWKSCLPVVFFAITFLVPMPLSAQEAIKEIKKITPKQGLNKITKKYEPLVIHSANDAAKYFGEKELAQLKEQVDFEKQVVLVFVWSGSGGDMLNYSVAESFPEQITFSIRPGRTRDLRSHVHVLALRSNVKWQVRK